MARKGSSRRKDLSAHLSREGARPTPRKMKNWVKHEQRAHHVQFGVVSSSTKIKGRGTPKAPQNSRKMLGAHPLHDHTGKIHAPTGARLTPKTGHMKMPKPFKPYKIPKGMHSKHRV